MRAILIIFALVFSSTVAANPGIGNPDCGMCHTNSGVGSVDVAPSPIDLFVGDTGEVTFSLFGIPEGANAAIALFGMDDAGLAATIGTPDDWTLSSGGYIYSSVFSNTTQDYLLTFDVGLGATLGTYLIEVKLAGGPGSDWIDLNSFDVNVVPSAIPVPAAVWLFGSGLIGLVGVARRRKPMVSQN